MMYGHLITQQLITRQLITAYRNGQRHRAVSLRQHDFLVCLDLNTARESGSRTDAVREFHVDGAAVLKARSFAE